MKRVCVMSSVQEPCTDEVVFGLTLQPYFLPGKPIDQAYIDALRQYPGATVHHHTECHQHVWAEIQVCFTHAGEAVELWVDWLNGGFDRVEDAYDRSAVTDADLLAAGYQKVGQDEWRRG